MKKKNPFSALSRGELTLWLLSLIAVTVSFIIPDERDYLTLIASLIGVTALIFVAKGMVFGQVLTVAFAVFYGIISFFFGYYGEMITYLCMSAPIAVLSIISWVKNPYPDTREVKVRALGRGEFALILLLSAVVTAAFYFILSALGNTNIVFSTVSVTTSFVASYLTFLRSPYYALAYAANDVVLIVLWVLASLERPSYFPMIICFAAFLANDLYGFYNWQRMKKRQSGE